MGLGDVDVGTYPSHPASNTVVNNNGGLMKGALLAASLLGAGGIGTLGMQLVTQPPSLTENSVAPTPALLGNPASSKPRDEVFKKVKPLVFDLVIESVEGDVKATVDP